MRSAATPKSQREVHEHLDAVRGHPEEPARLDDLEPLVHEGRGVDRDLAAHVPGRVLERLARGDVAEALAGAVAERAARRGEDEPLDLLRTPAVQALVQGAMFAVDGQEARPAGLRLSDHQLPRHHQRLLVGEGDVFPRLQGPVRGDQPDRAHRRRHHHRGVGMGGHGDRGVRAHAEA